MRPDRGSAGPTARERLLVVNADDFGLTPGVSEGILHTHREGIVTSTSVLANGPSFAEWVPRLLDAGIPAGVHLSVVGEDPLLLPPGELPSLVDGRGHPPLTWRQFVRRWASGRVDPDELHRELDAQIRAVRDAGVVPTHLDSHQNLHLLPGFTSVVIDLARRHDIRAIRLTSSVRLGPVALGVRALRRAAAVRVRAAGLVTTELAAGLDQAGSMDAEELGTTLERLAGGVGHADLTVHPGIDPDPARTRYVWGYRWADEADALTGSGLAQLVSSLGFRLGSFDDLAVHAAAGSAG